MPELRQPLLCLAMAWLTRTACGHVQGYRALLSSPWYLNLGVFDGSDWLTYYNVEPLAWKVGLNCHSFGCRPEN